MILKSVSYSLRCNNKESRLLGNQELPQMRKSMCINSIYLLHGNQENSNDYDPWIYYISLEIYLDIIIFTNSS